MTPRPFSICSCKELTYKLNCRDVGDHLPKSAFVIFHGLVPNRPSLAVVTVIRDGTTRFVDIDSLTELPEQKGYNGVKSA